MTKKNKTRNKISSSAAVRFYDAMHKEFIQNYKEAMRIEEEFVEENSNLCDEHYSVTLGYGDKTYSSLEVRKLLRLQELQTAKKSLIRSRLSFERVAEDYGVIERKDDD